MVQEQSAQGRRKTAGASARPGADRPGAASWAPRMAGCCSLAVARCSRAAAPATVGRGSMATLWNGGSDRKQRDDGIAPEIGRERSKLWPVPTDNSPRRGRAGTQQARRGAHTRWCTRWNPFYCRGQHFGKPAGYRATPPPSFPVCAALLRRSRMVWGMGQVKSESLRRPMNREAFGRGSDASINSRAATCVSLRPRVQPPATAREDGCDAQKPGSHRYRPFKSEGKKN